MSDHVGVRFLWQGEFELQPRLGRISVLSQCRTKNQAPNPKLQRNPGIETPKTKLQTPKKTQVPSSKPWPALRAFSLELLWSLELGVWDLVLLWSLEFGIWSLLPGLSASQKLRCAYPTSKQLTHKLE